MGQVVFGRCLRGGQADGRGKSPHHGADTGFVHLLDFGGARLRARLRVAQHGFDFGASERLDAAGVVDVLNGQHCTQATLLARIGQGARDRVQHTDLDGPGLCPGDQRERECRGRSSGLAHEVATCGHRYILYESQ
ncbi:hypothetical protein D9M69_651020 [compost metagenome]